MKRRNFIRSSAVGAALLTLTPVSGLFASPLKRQTKQLGNSFSLLLNNLKTCSPASVGAKFVSFANQTATAFQQKGYQVNTDRFLMMGSELLALPVTKNAGLTQQTDLLLFSRKGEKFSTALLPAKAVAQLDEFSGNLYAGLPFSLDRHQLVKTNVLPKQLVEQKQTKKASEFIFKTANGQTLKLVERKDNFHMIIHQA